MFTPELIRVTPFLGAKEENNSAEIALFGCPFDGTCSYRPGARFGPAALRAVSDVLETYCPRLKKDLEDVNFVDLGDLVLPPGDLPLSLDIVYNLTRQIVSHGQIPAAFGGEHLISLPVIRAVAERHPDVAIVHFDAHCDLRNNYLGVNLSHATVMRRVSDFVDPSHILHIGCRSGTREEFEEAELLGNLRPPSVTADAISEWVGTRPLYVTLDLDVLDPSVFPGTGTPEPGGVSFERLQDWLIGMSDCHWVGWDVVELSPPFDVNQISSIASAKIVRTMILASSKKLV